MTQFDWLLFLNLLFAGLLAGFEVAVHYGLGKPPDSLRDDAQIVLRQTLIVRLRILAPAIFLPTLVCGMAIAIRERHDGGLLLRSVALCGLFLWIVIRALRTVPVNSATLEWVPEAPPKNWRELVERTERYHVIAAWAAVITFISFLAAGLHHP